MARTFFLLFFFFVPLVCTSLLPAAPTRIESFTAVDTSALMGSPRSLPSLLVEEAFPNLKFPFPVDVKNAGDGSGRIFVVNQNGYIHVFPNRRDVKDAKIFLDVSDRVAREHFEEGLLAVEFHPKFRDNGEFFVYYSIQPLATRLSRFRLSKDDPGRGDPGSEEILLQVPQPYWNHNSGSLEFGPDGYLYVGFGDGGAANDPYDHGQNPDTLLGSIIRIDVDRQESGKKYGIPPDNPFVGRKDVLPETWALGIRNPWKLCFDRESGTLWFADVGQNSWEEVNIVRRGGNYGWNVREGRYPFDQEAKLFAGEFVDPVWSYDHSEGRSITGGVVYRGKSLPEIYGWYLCADWLSGNIWGLEYDGQRVVQSPRLVPGRYLVAAFGEDEEGEVYFAAHEEIASIVHEKTTYGKLYRFLRAPEPKLEVAGKPFPHKLSETGLFSSVKDMTPVSGLIPYEVNVPLWSDHAGKERYLALPTRGEVVFDETGNWEFPVGTVTVKTFFLDAVRGDSKTRRRLETRLMVLSERGWSGYTYVWNDEQTEATLLDGALKKKFSVRVDDRDSEQTWTFPSGDDCMGCHTRVKNHVLGLNTRQLNRFSSLLGENQLGFLDRLGVFTEPLPKAPEKLGAFPVWRDPTAAPDKLARAYLDSNCSMCHSPGGPGMTVTDLRYDIALEKTELVGRKPAVFRLGPKDARLIVPGDPDRSEIVHRLSNRGMAQMPPLSTALIDEEAVKIVRAWIEGLKKE